MTGSEWQKGEASMIRAVYASMELMEQGLKEGKDPLEMIQARKEWLTKCLYSCNMENFKESEFRPFEKE